MNDQDKAMQKGLIKILNDGTFSLKAREVRAFLEVVGWVNDLDKNFVRKPQPKTTEAKVPKK